ncbi:rRNA maturation RNase YbeY [bacterium]|nr:rRNA maturation RNase YbeY [bacterium]
MLEINNLTNRPLDEEFLNKVANKVLEEEKKDGVVSLVFVGPNRMRKMNYQYRKKNRVTDVLSFPEPPQKDFIAPPEAQKQLGEIVICPREVKKRAKREQSEFKKELARTLIHGLLHLLGYDHKKPKEAEIMLQKENKYLGYFF